MAKKPTRKTKALKSTSAARRKRGSNVAVTEVTERSVVRVPRPTVEEVTTKTEIETTPVVEIRKPATLAQALTEPKQVVVKPEKKARTRTVRKRRAA